MAAKILLYVSGVRATASLWRGGALSQPAHCANDREGWGTFGSLLAAHPGVPVYLSVDCVDEDYRSETLPHVRGSARQEMLSRKLKQVFRNAPYCAAWQQGRESNKRKDDRFLFVALTLPDLLRPWLDVIQLHGNPLAGIYLLPMVTHGLLGKLRLKEHHLLLVSEGSGGLRQTYFQEQNLKISRLTPLDAPSDDSRLATYAEEIAKTRLFLNSQRLMTRDDRLTVILLDCHEEFSGLCQQLNTDAGFSCRVLGNRELGSAFGMAPDAMRGVQDVLHLFALGLQAPTVSLAPAELTRGFRHYQARRAIYQLSLTVLLAAVTWGGVNYYRQLAALDEITLTQSNIRRHETLYQQIASQFPSTPTSPEKLKQTVEIAQTLQRDSRDPERLMAVVSHALDGNGDIALTRLHWKHRTTAGSDVEEGSRSVTNRLVTAANNLASGTAAPEAVGELAYLEGQVTPFQGDYRSAISHIKGFAANLALDKAVAEVSIMQLPLNVDPASSLSGSTLSGAVATDGARFKLKIVLRARS